MAQNLYYTVEQLGLSRDATEAAWTVTEEALMAEVLDTISRAVERELRQFFYRSTETRKYTPTDPLRLVLDAPLVSVTTLKTDTTGNQSYDTTWSASNPDYLLEPTNAALATPPDPYLWIDVNHASVSNGYTFPLTQRSVELVGVFGWPQVPPQIAMVVELEAKHMLAQRKTPTSIIGSPELGRFVVQPNWLPASLQLMRSLRRVRIGRASG